MADFLVGGVIVEGDELSNYCQSIFDFLCKFKKLKDGPPDYYDKMVNREYGEEVNVRMENIYSMIYKYQTQIEKRRSILLNKLSEGGIPMDYHNADHYLSSHLRELWEDKSSGFYHYTFNAVREIADCIPYHYGDDVPTMLDLIGKDFDGYLNIEENTLNISELEIEFEKSYFPTIQKSLNVTNIRDCLDPFNKKKIRGMRLLNNIENEWRIFTSRQSREIFTSRQNIENKGGEKIRKTRKNKKRKGIKKQKRKSKKNKRIVKRKSKRKSKKNKRIVKHKSKRKSRKVRRK